MTTANGGTDHTHPEASRRGLRAGVGWAAAVLVLALVLAACGGGGGGGGTPSIPDDAPDRAVLVEGQRIYGNRCATCHGTRGQGGTGMQLNDERVLQDLTEEEHLDVVRNGRNAMPAFGESLSDDEIEAVVRYEREIIARQ